ncbi:esterase [Actinocatenispora thailandica]|uniref:Esterase n=1 Tax=Actinocatenispora thailandica TaxID=227318 RepID=A0A7R7DUT9_9ACTN|nr:alpha/beta fold hydrolase [Actinocatenispora thailandica]BCJ38244.1 esterase [Actinocatenispora thailandica]
MQTSTTFVLVPGFWLGAWAWDAVAAALRAAGHRAVPVTLPGLDPDDPQRAAATVPDQAEYLRGVIAEADGPVALVAHSGANLPTSVLLDQDPAAVARVIYVDSGPVADGAGFDPSVPADLAELPLPPFDQLQASLDGLDEGTLRTFRERAVPEPGAVLREPVHLRNDARRDVPTTIVACSYPSELMLKLAREGNPMMAETATLRDLDVVDLPTGHWPMWSRPADLATAIADAAS